MRVTAATALILAALGATLATGCGKQPAPDPGRSESAGSAASESGGAADERGDGAKKAEDTVFAPLLNDVQRARGVQGTVDEQAERLKKEIEKQEGANGGSN